MHNIIMSTLKKGLKKMNDMPITGNSRKATEKYYLIVYHHQLKPGLLACEYKIPFKDYFTVDEKLTLNA